MVRSKAEALLSGVLWVTVVMTLLNVAECSLWNDGCLIALRADRQRQLVRFIGDRKVCGQRLGECWLVDLGGLASVVLPLLGGAVRVYQPQSFLIKQPSLINQSSRVKFRPLVL